MTWSDKIAITGAEATPVALVTIRPVAFLQIIEDDVVPIIIVTVLPMTRAARLPALSSRYFHSSGGDQMPKFS